MNFLLPQIAAMGGGSWPSYESTTGTGRKVTVVGGAVTKGDILRACTDDNESALDDSKAFGPTSWNEVYEALASGDATNYAHCGLFAVALEDADDDGECRVAEFGLVEATFTTSGAVTPLRPFMADFTTNPGELIEFDGTGKCIALNATAISGATSSGTGLFLFSGFFPIAQTINTTA